MTTEYPPSILYPMGIPYRRGADVPQHRLLSRCEWARLTSGAIRRFTYYVTTGDHRRGKHAGFVVVTAEDAP